MKTRKNEIDNKRVNESVAEYFTIRFQNRKHVVDISIPYRV